MKNFFSSFMGALLALIVFFVGGTLACLVMLMAVAAMNGDRAPTVEKGSYLVLDLSGNIQDAPDQMQGLDDLMDALGGGRMPRRLQLRQVVRAIRAAASDDAIAGLYLTGTLMPDGYGSGYAALREVRQAIEAFRKSGKPVKGYFTGLDTRDFYLASVATDLVLDPYGIVMLPGLASQPMFFAGALEKLGVGVQVTRVGKYKSAVEPYTRKDMSPESREQVQKLIDDIWRELLAEMAKARGLAPADLQKLVDSHGVIRAEDALKAKLVDRSAYYDEVQKELKQKTGVTGAKKSFKQVSIKAYARLVSGEGAKATRAGGKSGGAASKGQIAVVYAEGSIVDGHGTEPGTVYGETYARELQRLRQDENVKAIVLRVNSPGGSASASEAIQRELRLAMEKKPVIVSMGSVAASGGYWISAFSHRIFVEPVTITGSIGVFGMFLNVRDLANDKLGVTFDTVKTGKMADLMTITRPKTEGELAVFQGLVDWIYEQFVTKVAEGRRLPADKVREIGQGRVWSGSEAVALGLADEMGGMEDAVKFAAGKAGLGESFRISEFPRQKQFGEVLAEAFEGKQRDANASSGPLNQMMVRAQQEWKALSEMNDPRGIYARLPWNLALP